MKKLIIGRGKYERPLLREPFMFLDMHEEADFRVDFNESYSLWSKLKNEIFQEIYFDWSVTKFSHHGLFLAGQLGERLSPGGVLYYDISTANGGTTGYMYPDDLTLPKNDVYYYTDVLRLQIGTFQPYSSSKVDESWDKKQHLNTKRRLGDDVARFVNEQHPWWLEGLEIKYHDGVYPDPVYPNGYPKEYEGRGRRGYLTFTKIPLVVNKPLVMNKPLVVNRPPVVNKPLVVNRPLGMTLVKVKGDGSCFFHSICVALLNYTPDDIDEKSKHLRGVLWDTYNKYGGLLKDNGGDAARIEDVIKIGEQNFIDSKDWGEGVDCIAFSFVFNLKINVWVEGEGVQPYELEGGPDDFYAQKWILECLLMRNKQPINIRHTLNHYDAYTLDGEGRYVVEGLKRCLKCHRVKYL